MGIEQLILMCKNKNGELHYEGKRYIKVIRYSHEIDDSIFFNHLKLPNGLNYVTSNYYFCRAFDSFGLSTYRHEKTIRNVTFVREDELVLSRDASNHFDKTFIQKTLAEVEKQVLENKSGTYTRKATELNDSVHKDIFDVTFDKCEIIMGVNNEFYFPTLRMPGMVNYCQEVYPKILIIIHAITELIMEEEYLSKEDEFDLKFDSESGIYEYTLEDTLKLDLTISDLGEVKYYIECNDLKLENKLREELRFVIEYFSSYDRDLNLR